MPGALTVAVIRHAERADDMTAFDEWGCSEAAVGRNTFVFFFFLGGGCFLGFLWVLLKGVFSSGEENGWVLDGFCYVSRFFF